MTERKMVIKLGQMIKLKNDDGSNTTGNTDKWPANYV